MLDGDCTSNIFYLIHFHQSVSYQFVISLNNPIVVLQIIQSQFGPDLSEVALQLASRGISFGIQTISKTVPPPTKSSAELPIGLSFNYRHFPSNYISYFDKREDGIIAHLACDSLSDCMDVLMHCRPSEDVFKYGMAIKIEAEYFWDDDLDLNNEQVILQDLHQ